MSEATQVVERLLIIDDVVDIAELIGELTPLGERQDGMDILTRLRLKGIKLALVDFGADKQAITCLYALPISEVKIDGCLTADLAKEHGAKLLFFDLVDIAHEMDIVCCAEGVETAEQPDVLDEVECDLAQGFHINAPVPPADIPKAIASWTTETPPQTKVAPDNSRAMHPLNIDETPRLCWRNWLSGEDVFAHRGLF